MVLLEDLANVTHFYAEEKSVIHGPFEASKGGFSWAVWGTRSFVALYVALMLSLYELMVVFPPIVYQFNIHENIPSSLLLLCLSVANSLMQTVLYAND